MSTDQDPQITFDPQWLQKAADELGKLNTLLELNQDFGQLQQVSTVAGDLGSLMKEDNGRGAWTFVENHTSGICDYISKITGKINQQATTLEGRMQDTVNTLKGADDSNKRNLQSKGAS